jgi:hypothetical protein
MNIERAISHFEFRLVEKDSKGKIKLKGNLKPNLNDLKAYNAIIEYKEKQEDINLEQNENLAKLWVHTLMTLNVTNLYSAEQCIVEIDKILEPTVYDWCLLLQEKLPIMKFSAIGQAEFPLTPIEQMSASMVMDNNKKIVDKYPNELMDALLSKPKIENVVRFVKNHVTRII